MCLSACVAEDGGPRGFGSQRHVMRRTSDSRCRAGSSRTHEVLSRGTSGSPGELLADCGCVAAFSSSVYWHISKAFVGMMGNMTVSGDSSTKELNIVGSEYRRF